LNEVLKLLKQNKINTIISTVASNLKQKPFESINTEDLSADKHFSLGDENFEKGNYKLAKLNYISAKEKDALRFRAPEKINEIIKDFGNIYNVPVANTDSILSKKSIGEITGYNLMVDHLHPNVKAHQLIGDLFFETMIENSFLPKSEKQKYTLEDQLKFADNSLAYTKFDSTYAKIVLSNLLNTYPFTTQTEPKSKTYSLITSIDSLAEKVVIGEISWEKGHYLAAEIYFENDEYDLFLSEMNTLIQDKPFIKYNYTYAVDKLRSVGKLDVALQLLIKMNRKFNDEYSAKLIGNIGISKKSYSLAIYFYKKFIDLNQNDPDVFYNISGAYLYSKMVDKAIISLEKCLEISPNYPNAKSTLERLQRAKQ
jgi:tetratricopeptide (TPR) repeat protein